MKCFVFWLALLILNILCLKIELLRFIMLQIFTIYSISVHYRLAKHKMELKQFRLSLLPKLSSIKRAVIHEKQKYNTKYEDYDIKLIEDLEEKIKNML